MANVRKRAYEILEIPSAPGDTPGHVFDAFIITLISLNVLAVVFETVGDNAVRYGAWLDLFETASLLVFALEYVLRLWSIVEHPSGRYRHPVWGRLRFAATPTALIDLVAILPAIIPIADLRFVRVVRLLRVLKLGRYSEGAVVLATVLRKRRDALLTSLAIVLLALLIVSSFMYYAEHDAQPDAFASIPHAMYWGVIAITTTGYGDVVPVTPFGQFLAGITALIGVGVIALPVGILASGFVTELEARKAKNGHRVCPHCGGDVPPP